MKKRKLLWLWLLFLAVIGTVTANSVKGGAHTKTAQAENDVHAVAVTSKGATTPPTPELHRRWKCTRLGRVSTKESPNNRCWYYCFNAEAYRVYRLPEKNGTPCRVYKKYPPGTCRYSRCRQPGRRHRGWLTGWIFYVPKHTST
ncbi:uncharacterized protein LOC144145848 isoform X2 [Haemaphysalis longicornis]